MSYVLSATGQVRYLRANVVIIRGGTNTGTIKICTVNVDSGGLPYTEGGAAGPSYGTYYNPIDNVGKGQTVGPYWLSPDGGYVVINTGKILQGLISSEIIGNNYPFQLNPLWQPLYMFPNITEQRHLRLDFIQNNNGVVDLTLLGGYELDMLISYLTSD